jgi:predicted phosphodiesterase
LRVALLADVHGNSIALERCIAILDALGADDTYFLGDCVGYLPGEQECLELLTAREITCQRGNHEQMLLFPTEESRRQDEVYGLEAVAGRMSAAAVQAIRSWPLKRELELGGRDVLLVHGSPDSPLDGYVYPDTDLSPYKDCAYDAVLMANTHRPFVRQVGDAVMANVGSVGLPRDVGRLSSMAVYDTQTNQVKILRPQLDVEAVLSRWGREIHPATRACFSRTSSTFVGDEIP